MALWKESPSAAGGRVVTTLRSVSSRTTVACRYDLLSRGVIGKKTVAQWFSDNSPDTHIALARHAVKVGHNGHLSGSGRLFARNSRHSRARMGRIPKSHGVYSRHTAMPEPHATTRRRLRRACISRSVSDIPPQMP